MDFNLDFLDSIWKPIGKGLSEADTFVKREMPFDSGWGAPAAAVAAYFGGPAVMSALGEGSLGAGEGVAGGSVGGGGFLDGVGSLFGGGSSGGFGLDPSMGSGVSSTGFGTTSGSTFGGLNPNMASGVSSTGYGTTGGSTFGSLNPSLGISDSITSSGLGDLSPSSGGGDWQKMLGKALMQQVGKSSSGHQGYQYQEPPVQRQGAFLPNSPSLPIQDKQSDVAALIALLKSKGTL